jgi:hypothetical protein
MQQVIGRFKKMFVQKLIVYFFALLVGLFVITGHGAFGAAQASFHSDALLSKQGVEDAISYGRNIGELIGAVCLLVIVLEQGTSVIQNAEYNVKEEQKANTALYSVQEYVSYPARFDKSLNFAITYIFFDKTVPLLVVSAGINYLLTGGYATYDLVGVGAVFIGVMVCVSLSRVYAESTVTIDWEDFHKNVHHVRAKYERVRDEARHEETLKT